jgi:hypothetical protein
MRRLHLLLLACAACGEGLVRRPPDDLIDAEAWEHDLVVVRSAAPAAAERPLAASQPLTLFLNGKGAIYTAASDDEPRSNKSTVVSYLGMGSAQVPAFAGSSGEWKQYLECVKETYAPFNIVVTDVEPASGSYIEIASGGSSEEVFGQSFGGIAPMGCNGVGPAIVFVMTDSYPGQPLDACWTAAQESAHALGLDHELECSDPMTYLTGCALPKRFQDRAVACGEYSRHACTCTGQASQNSFEWIAGEVGLAGSCTPACAGKACGAPDGCGASCAPGSGCSAGCTPRCAGKACGAGDGCGAPCQPGSGCNAGCTPVCQGVVCGFDDGCGGPCLPGSGCTPECAPNCAGVTCGFDDGCNGPCVPGSGCTDRGCCQAQCSGKKCGADDGCGGLCQRGSGCDDSQCSCAGKTCGDPDGCGGTCAPGSGCTSGSTDTTPPTVAILSPPDGEAIPRDTPVIVTVRAEDDTALAEVSLVWQFTGETWGCPTSRAGVTCTHQGDTFTWALTPGAGNRTFQAVARDPAGNVAKTAPRTVKVLGSTLRDLEVSVESPYPGQAFASGDEVAVVVKVGGGGTDKRGILNWTSPYGQRAFKMRPTSSGFVLSAVLGVGGRRTFSVTVGDAAGHAASTPPITFDVR